MAAPNNISINPKVKQNFIDSVKEYEGYEPKPYKDSQGVLTIGHGINLEDTFNKEYIKKHTPYKVNDVIRGKVKFTEKDSEKYINHKLNNVYREVKKYHPDIDKYPTEVQQIILDMDYNMGPTRFSKFKNFNSAVQKGNYSKAAEELKNSNYFKQTGRRAAAHYSTLAGLTPPVVQPVPEEMGFFDKLKTSFQIMPTSFMTPLIPMMTTPGFADGGKIPSWSPGMTGPPPMPMGFSPEQRERFGLFTEQGDTPYNLQYNAGRYSGVPAGMSMHYGDETGVPDSPCGPGFAIDYDANGFEVCVPIGLKTSGVTPAAVVTSTGSSYGNVGPRTIEEARMRHLRNMAARGPQKRLETFSEEYTMAPVSGTLKTEYTEPFKRESKLGKEPEAKRKLRKGSSFHRGTGFSKFFRGLGTAIRECLPGEDCPKMERGGWVYPANTAYPEYRRGGKLTKKGKKRRKYGPRPNYMNQNPNGMTTGPITQRSIGNTPGGGYMSFEDGGPVWEIIDDRPMAGDGMLVKPGQVPQGYFLNPAAYDYKTKPKVFVAPAPTKEERLANIGRNAAKGTAEPMVGMDDPIFNALTLGHGLIKGPSTFNPWRFEPSKEMMYRGIGKEGMEDALKSGVFRSKQNVDLVKTGNFTMSKQFGNPYFSPSFETANRYGQGYIAEVPVSSAQWRRRYGNANKTWSQIASREIPINEGRILQKDWLRGYKEISKPNKKQGGKVSWQIID